MLEKFPLLKTNEPLSRYTTFGIGGRAKYFLVAKSENDFKKAVAFSRKKKLPWR